MSINNNLLNNCVQRPVWWHLDIGSVRAMYRNSYMPTLIMLLCALAYIWLLHDTDKLGLLLAWVTAVFGLTGLRLISARLFARASKAQQEQSVWRYLLVVCACFSGILLSFFAVLFIPEEGLAQQLLLLGILLLVAASTGIAFAISFFTFIFYVVCGFLPIIWLYLSADSEVQQRLGLLVLMCLAAITVAVIQVNRLLYQTTQQRAKNQDLIRTLQLAQQHTETLNAELIQEIAHKEVAEQKLLSVQAGLEKRVSLRTAELKSVVQALEKSQERLEMALDASQLALWDWDLATDEIHHTRTQCIFGLEKGSVRNVLRDLRPLLHPDDLPVLRNALLEHLQQRTKGYVVEYRVKHQQGHWVWIEDRGRAVQRNAEGRVLRMLGTRRDISERKQQDEELRLASKVFDAGTESIVIFDPQYTVLAVNQAYTAVTGFARAQVVGRPLQLQGLPAKVLKQYELIRVAINQRGSWEGESLHVRQNGEIYPQWLQLRVVRNAVGETTHIVGFFTDLTVHRKTEERLSYLTHYDELTELSNRTLFHERLDKAVDKALHTDSSVALLHIDLDRFKLLNDSLGVEVADQVLRTISRRLIELLPQANTLARLGGNEFAVVLDNCSSIASLEHLAATILATIRRPISMAGNELIISASIGVSLLSDSTRDSALLISQAGVAMGYAKHLGGDNYQFFNSQLQTCTLERLHLEQQLRRGIEEGQLQAYYQPKLTVADGLVHSAEALVRWNHPQRGLVSPGEFIPLAEETGLIGAISELMLLQACEQGVLWLQQGMPIRVSVNISVSHIRQGNLVALVQDVLRKTGLPASLLELELTETQMLENADRNIATFKLLSELGVHLTIDDFGTGYSSLSYLKRFPVQTLKIDQSFIHDVVSNEEDAAITRTIIAMAHSLNLSVVAEGVETQEQLEFLTEHACDIIQGYLICTPVPAEQLSEFLIAHQQPQAQLSLS